MGCIDRRARFNEKSTVEKGQVSCVDCNLAKSADQCQQVQAMGSSHATRAPTPVVSVMQRGNSWKYFPAHLEVMQITSPI